MIPIRVFVRSVCDGPNLKVFRRLLSRRVGIIGVPFDKGQKKYGVAAGPAAMRSAGLISELRQIVPIEVKDYGDIIMTEPEGEVPFVENMRNLAIVGACNKEISTKVTEVLKDDRLAITIGGDHSIAIGTVDGHLQVHEDLILIWVDAHSDINTNTTSTSGSIHGMTVAIFVKEFTKYWVDLPSFDWQKRTFSLKSLGYIGLRSVDPYERLAIIKYQIPCYAMENIEEIGIQRAIHTLIETLDPSGARPIHVSYDIDALDVLEAPSTGTPVRAGLTLREGIQIMEAIYATGRLRAVDLVEVNPIIGNEDDRNRTLNAGICVLKAAVGYDRKGSAPIDADDLPIPNKST